MTNKNLETFILENMAQIPTEEYLRFSGETPADYAPLLLYDDDLMLLAKQAINKSCESVADIRPYIKSPCFDTAYYDGMGLNVPIKSIFLGTGLIRKEKLKKDSCQSNDYFSSIFEYINTKMSYLNSENYLKFFGKTSAEFKPYFLHYCWDDMPKSLKKIMKPEYVQSFYYYSKKPHEKRIDHSYSPFKLLAAIGIAHEYDFITNIKFVIGSTYNDRCQNYLICGTALKEKSKIR